MARDRKGRYQRYFPNFRTVITRYTHEYVVAGGDWWWLVVAGGGRSSIAAMKVVLYLVSVVHIRYRVLPGVKSTSVRCSTTPQVLQGASLCGRHLPPATLAQEGCI